MTKFRQVGDIVRKKPNAGFVGQSLIIRLTKGFEHCILCTNPHCKEWTNCEILDENNQPTGKFCYHVSECEMEDENKYQNSNT